MSRLDKISVLIFEGFLSSRRSYMRLPELFSGISLGTWRGLVKEIRANPAQKKELQKMLPQVVFGADFHSEGRTESDISLLKPVLCLDIDAQDNLGVDLLSLRARLKLEDSVAGFFVSLGGHGLKVLVRLPQCYSIPQWKEFAAAAIHYYEVKYAIKIDPHSKSPVGLCTVSYDPEAFEKFSALEFDPETPIIQPRTTTASNWKSDGQNFLRGFDAAEFENLPGMLDNYTDWYRFGFALATEMGEAGRELFHKVSSQSQKYDPRYCDKTYSKLLKNNRGEITGGTLRAMITRYHREHGTTPPPNSQTTTKQKLKEEAEAKPANALIFTEEDFVEQLGFLEEVSIGRKKLFNHEAFFRFCEKYLRLHQDPYDPNGFLQVKGGFLHKVREEKILAVIKDYLRELLANYDEIQVQNAQGRVIFAMNKTQVLSFIEGHHADITRKNVLSQLSVLELEGRMHFNNSEGLVFSFYEDVVVAISEAGNTTISYEDFFKDNIFVYAQEVAPFKYTQGRADKSDVAKFVRNITRDFDGNLNSEREKWARLLLGYLCTPFNFRIIKNPAVVLSDINIDGLQAGRTGKGIFAKFVKYFLMPSARLGRFDRRFVLIDGRQLNSESRFKFDSVNSETRVLLLNDITKNHSIDQYFVAVEDGLTVEKKGSNKMLVRTKLILSTNFSVSVEGASMRDRFWELGLSSHYSDEHKPLDDFGRLFFCDWLETDWADFDAYMFECIQLYLAENARYNGNIPQHVDDTITHKKLTDLVGLEICEWVENVQIGDEIGLKFGVRYLKKDLFRSFSEMYPKSKLSTRGFWEKIRLFKKYHPDFEADRVNSKGEREQEGHNGKQRYIIFLESKK